MLMAKNKQKLKSIKHKSTEIHHECTSTTACCVKRHNLKQMDPRSNTQHKPVCCDEAHPMIKSLKGLH